MKERDVVVDRRSGHEDGLHIGVAVVMQLSRIFWWLIISKIMDIFLLLDSFEG